MSPMVRGAVLADFPETALQAGLDPLAELRAAGIDPAVCRQGDMPVSSLRAGRLLENAAEHSGLADFAIRLAMRRQVAHLGVSGLVLSQQRTVRAALAMAARYRHLLNEALVAHVEDDGETAVIRVDMAAAAGGELPQVRELSVAAFVQIFWLLIGSDWRPQSVHFVHPAPAGATLHQRYFGCPVVFESAFNGFACTTADIDRVNPRADAALAGYASMLLDALPGGRAQAVPEIVGQLVRVLLPMGKASIGNVARMTGKSVRTLQRELDASGVTFKALVSDARRTLCLGYLQQPRMPVTRIAELLGYASSPAFIRWFRGSFGMSPQRWRTTRPG